MGENDLFEGESFYFLNEQKRNKTIIKLIKKHKGTVVDDIKDCTYVLCDDMRLYYNRGISIKPFIKTKYISACNKRKARVPIFEHLTNRLDKKLLLPYKKFDPATSTKTLPLLGSIFYVFNNNEEITKQITDRGGFILKDDIPLKTAEKHLKRVCRVIVPERPFSFFSSGRRLHYILGKLFLDQKVYIVRHQWLKDVTNGNIHSDRTFGPDILEAGVKHVLTFFSKKIRELTLIKEPLSVVKHYNANPSPNNNSPTDWNVNFLMIFQWFYDLQNINFGDNIKVQFFQVICQLLDQPQKTERLVSLFYYTKIFENIFLYIDTMEGNHRKAGLFFTLFSRIILTNLQKNYLEDLIKNHFSKYLILLSSLNKIQVQLTPSQYNTIINVLQISSLYEIKEFQMALEVSLKDGFGVYIFSQIFGNVMRNLGVIKSIVHENYKFYTKILSQITVQKELVLSIYQYALFVLENISSPNYYFPFDTHDCLLQILCSNFLNDFFQKNTNDDHDLESTLDVKKKKNFSILVLACSIFNENVVTEHDEFVYNLFGRGRLNIGVFTDKDLFNSGNILTFVGYVKKLKHCTQFVRRYRKGFNNFYASFKAIFLQNRKRNFKVVDKILLNLEKDNNKIDDKERLLFREQYFEKKHHTSTNDNEDITILENHHEDEEVDNDEEDEENFIHKAKVNNFVFPKTQSLVICEGKNIPNDIIKQYPEIVEKNKKFASKVILTKDSSEVEKNFDDIGDVLGQKKLKKKKNEKVSKNEVFVYMGLNEIVFGKVDIECYKCEVRDSPRLMCCKMNCTRSMCKSCVCEFFDDDHWMSCLNDKLFVCHQCVTYRKRKRVAKKEKEPTTKEKVEKVEKVKKVKKKKKVKKSKESKKKSRKKEKKYEVKYRPKLKGRKKKKKKKKKKKEKMIESDGNDEEEFESNKRPPTEEDDESSEGTFEYEPSKKKRKKK